jgi:NADPH2:quinone reductase
MRGYITDPEAPDGLRFATNLPEPQPAEGEALVEVRAFAVNPGELRLLKRRPDGFRPGQDVGGVVLSAASDGSGPPAGARVVGVVDWHGWAERIAVPTNQLALIADSVSFEQAAALPIAGLTALRALRAVGAILGSRVLVTGATGGVGQFAVQLAVAGGAIVTAQVSAPSRAAQAQATGATFTCTDIDKGVGPFDAVLDGVAGSVLEDALHRLKPGGTLVTYGAASGAAKISLLDFPRGPSSKMVALSHYYPADERGADIGILAGFVADGRLVPQIGSLRDWSELPATLEDVRTRKVRGRAVLLRS